VLTFGGPPTFEPSAWEWVFRAMPLLQSDPARARAILTDGLDTFPDSAALHYNLACLDATDGHLQDAIARLRHAIELRPDLAESARTDTDLTALQDNPEFKALIS
jgi:Flp pilus assembly protein TadD